MRIPRLRPSRALPALLMSAAAVLVIQPAPLASSAQERQAVARQHSPAPLPSARSVVDRHIAAIGGRDAVLAHSSSHVTGTITMPAAGLSGTLEVFAAKPNRSLVRIALAGVGEMQEGFDGTIGWSISPLTGPSVLEGRQLEQRKFDSDFYADLQRDGRYVSMTTIENAMFEGRACYKLRLVRPGGDEDFHFYDAATGLKAGSITTRETPMGPITGTSVESEYRRFGRLLQPTKITQTAMGLQQVMTVSTVEYDKVAPAVFEPPAQIKALIK